MLELPNPFGGEAGVIRLPEPPEADREAIVHRVLSGLYDKPFVIEDDGSRCLYFTRAFIQSEMRLADPAALEFAYTRKMKGFLLFLLEPRAILMLGLGGGSLAKYCRRHLPAARITDTTMHASCVAPIPMPTGMILPPGCPTVLIG